MFRLLVLIFSISGVHAEENKIYEGWTPMLSQAEKKAVEMYGDKKKSSNNFRIKDGKHFRGIVCPAGAEIIGSTASLLVIQSSEGCYLEKTGEKYKFVGKIEIPKKSMNYIDHLYALIQKVKKHNFKNFNFIVGYDEEIENRLKKLGISAINYVPSQLLPEVHGGAMQIILLERQNIKGFSIPSKSSVHFTKNEETGEDELGAIFTNGNSIKLNTLSCTTFVVRDTDSVTCTISEGVNLGDRYFPDGTQFEIEKNSIGKEKLNVLSAINSAREIKISGEVVPRDHTIIFSNSTYKIVPPPKE